MSRDAAHRLLALSPAEQKTVLKAYEDFKDPIAVFRRLSQPERVKSLAGEKISSFIVIETDAVTFFPTVYSYIPGVLDYAVATNRRLFCQGLWFPIISLNSEYIRKSSDRVLRFALEHEFEMNRIYQEISLNLKTLSQGERRDIMDSSKEITTERLKITQEELIEDEKLMYQLSKIQPLLPKPYAEKAMLRYLEANLPELQLFGQKSQSPRRRPSERSFTRSFRAGPGSLRRPMSSSSGRSNAISWMRTRATAEP
jgi:hypothetical protein